jgi:hypothetical protein
VVVAAGHKKTQGFETSGIAARVVNFIASAKRRPLPKVDKGHVLS